MNPSTDLETTTTEPDTFRGWNRLALVFLIAGKVFGLAGLIVAVWSRLIGAALLGLSGLFVTVSVILCIRTMRARQKQDEANEAGASTG